MEGEHSQITTLSPDDIFAQESKEFLKERFEDAGDYHKLIFGKITGVWIP